MGEEEREEKKNNKKTERLRAGPRTASRAQEETAQGKQRELLTPPGCCNRSPAYVLIHGFGDELALAVDAGVGSLASDLLLLFGNAARGRGAPASVQRA